MIVSGWAGDFVVPDSLGCAEGSVPEIALCFGSGKNSSVLFLVFECLCWLAGIAFGSCHPNLLLDSCKWDNSVPIHITLVWCCSIGAWLIWFLGLNLYGQIRILGSQGIVGRGNWSIFPQFKKIARHFCYLRPRSIAGIRPGYCFYLVFLCGNQPFSFFCCFWFLPYLGIGFRLRGSELIGLWLGFWSQFSFQLKVGLHFLNDSGAGAECYMGYI